MIYSISLKAYDLNGIGTKSIAPEETVDAKKSTKKDPTPEEKEHWNDDVNDEVGAQRSHSDIY